MNERSNQSMIQNAIKKIAGTLNVDIVDILFAEVLSVDKESRTCSVKPVSGSSDTPIEDVSLTLDKNDGELKIPSIGSTVGVVVSADMDPFIIAWSDLDEIVLKGGGFYGLVKVKELTEKLNAVENDLNKIKQAFSSWVTVPNDGGAALKASAASWYSQNLTVTDQSDIENKKITHGNS